MCMHGSGVGGGCSLSKVIENRPWTPTLPRPTQLFFGVDPTSLSILCKFSGSVNNVPDWYSFLCGIGHLHIVKHFLSK